MNWCLVQEELRTLIHLRLRRELGSEKDYLFIRVPTKWEANYLVELFLYYLSNKMFILFSNKILTFFILLHKKK